MNETEFEYVDEEVSQAVESVWGNNTQEDSLENSWMEDVW